MNKLLKRISLISLSIFTLMSWTSQVQAKSECVEHTNYYFLQGMWYESKFDYYNNEIDHPNKDEAFVNTIYLPSLEYDFNQIQNVKESTINPKTAAEIDDYYDSFKKFFKKGESEEKTYTHQIDSKNQTEKYKYYESEDGTKHYYYHTTFYTDENQKDEPTVECVEGCTLDDVKKAALRLYGEPKVTRETDWGVDKISITRKFANSNNAPAVKSEVYEGITPLKVKWYNIEGIDSSEALNTYVSPVLYKITYEVCDKPTYNATIDYLNKDTNDKVADSHVDAYLEDGYTKEITSPEVKNCTPDKEKVTIKIEGEDFKEVVYYTCKEETNPETGNVLIFIAWTVGLGALGYSIYWFKKNKQEEV